jgi:hypothetical protein
VYALASERFKPFYLFARAEGAKGYFLPVMHPVLPGGIRNEAVHQKCFFIYARDLFCGLVQAVHKISRIPFYYHKRLIYCNNRLLLVKSYPAFNREAFFGVKYH